MVLWKFKLSCGCNEGIEDTWFDIKPEDEIGKKAVCMIHGVVTVKDVS